jgi:hypothetical protein
MIPLAPILGIPLDGTVGMVALMAVLTMSFGSVSVGRRWDDNPAGVRQLQRTPR